MRTLLRARSATPSSSAARPWSTCARDCRSAAPPLSLSTLSYWRSGERQPEGKRSVEAIENLEEILGLPPGHLTGLLDPSQASLVRLRGAHAVLDPGEKVTDVLHDLGDMDPTHLTEVSTHLTLDLDEQGDMRTFRYRTVWQANVDEVRGPPIVLVLDPPIGQPELTFMEGCTLGRTASTPCQTVHGFELLFPRPLMEGEQALTEIAGALPPGLHDPEMHHGLLAPIHELLLWVRFHPTRVPARAESYFQRGAEMVTAPLAIEGTSAFVRRTHVGPGRVGIQWAWRTGDLDGQPMTSS